jgi:alkyl hydroperoxide reductase subunit F
MKELVIIGGGPAGLTAAVYAARQNINLKIIAEDIGGQAALSSQVENYTGFQVVSGAELIEKFEEHVSRAGVEIQEGARVSGIKEESGEFKIDTDDGECCSARAVLITTGANPRKLNVEGEDKFLNKGLAYCATCDAPLFKGKDVAVIGGGNSALDAARQLIGIAGKIYIITNEDKLGGEAVLREKIVSDSSVEVISSSTAKKITGDKLVNGLVIQSGQSERRLEVEGVFVEIGWVPASDFLDIADKNSRGEIIIDCNNRTSQEGLFAAGDVTDVSKKQIIIAAGEGAKAVLNAIDYLSKS